MTIDDRTITRSGRDALHELGDLKAVDVDTHCSEPHDRWPSPVPARYREVVSHVVDDGRGGECRVYNGGDVLYPHAGVGSVVHLDGIEQALLHRDLRYDGVPEVQRTVLSANEATLYRLPIR